VSKSNRTYAHTLGIAVSKAELESLPIERHTQHGAWNCTVEPPKTVHDSGRQPTRGVSWSSS
jgi:hypothetical protein